MFTATLLLSLLACGGDTKTEAKPAEKPAAEKPAEKPAAPPPAAAPAPAPAPVAAPTGPYTPDEFAKAAYEKAVAAGADKKPNAKKGDAAAIAAGKATYEGKCVTCHGATGAGEGVAGQALPQKAAAFSHKERWDATPIGTKQWIVMNGIQGTGMAALGLTDDQAWEVLAYIESSFAPK